ncbi:hypothetical protein [Frankia tisae]|uniref:hypothetical protein n=1 Tax=Frankia tisae TaxID=2950104 RepID=UPI0021BE27F0|nr:hypothetical protein [Frankia tisae]
MSTEVPVEILGSLTLPEAAAALFVDLVSVEVAEGCALERVADSDAEANLTWRLVSTDERREKRVAIEEFAIANLGDPLFLNAW